MVAKLSLATEWLAFVAELTVYPEPEFFNGNKYIVAFGEAAVEPSNVISGSTRHTNMKLCPSSKSNWAEMMNDSMGSVTAVALSSNPSSWFTRLL
jgi:hypothetical protein